MLEKKIERVSRLLKALDVADGKEDFIIHRDDAVNYIKGELERLQTSMNEDRDSLTREELIMSLNALNASPASFKRKTEEEVFSILSTAQQSAVASIQTAAADHSCPHCAAKSA